MRTHTSIVSSLFIKPSRVINQSGALATSRRRPSFVLAGEPLPGRHGVHQLSLSRRLGGREWSGCQWRSHKLTIDVGSEVQWLNSGRHVGLEICCRCVQQSCRASRQRVQGQKVDCTGVAVVGRRKSGRPTGIDCRGAVRRREAAWWVRAQVRFVGHTQLGGSARGCLIGERVWSRGPGAAAAAAAAGAARVVPEGHWNQAL